MKTIDLHKALKLIGISLFLGLLVGTAHGQEDPSLADLKDVQVDLTTARRHLVAEIAELQKNQAFIQEEQKKLESNLQEIEEKVARGVQRTISINLQIQSEQILSQMKALDLKRSELGVKLKGAQNHLAKVEKDLLRYSRQIGNGQEDMSSRFGKVKAETQYDGVYLND